MRAHQISKLKMKLKVRNADLNSVHVCVKEAQATSDGTMCRKLKRNCCSRGSASQKVRCVSAMER